MLLWPKANVVTTLCFRRRVSDLVLTLQQRRKSDVISLKKNLKVFHCYYNCPFPKIFSIALQFHFLMSKIYSVCVIAKHSLKWWIFENLQPIAWTQKIFFWFCVVRRSETAPCFLAVNLLVFWLISFSVAGIKTLGIIPICYMAIQNHFEFTLIWFLQSIFKTIYDRCWAKFPF